MWLATELLTPVAALPGSSGDASKRSDLLGGVMQQGNTGRRHMQALKTSRVARATLRQDDEFGAAMKALEALNTAYKRLTRVLNAEIDRSKSGVDEISALGGQLRWVTERQSLVKTALRAGPSMVAYVCEDCQEVTQLRSLAEMAAELAGESSSYPTTLNLLSYIDQELGWTPLAQTA